MIGKAIAGEAKATFFYISASSLTSKWVCFCAGTSVIGYTDCTNLVESYIYFSFSVKIVDIIALNKIYRETDICNTWKLSMAMLFYRQS